MVDDQLARSVEKVGKRQRSPRRKISRKIPPELVTNLENIVVGYGESSHGEGGRKPSARSPVFWVAQRLKGGDPFRCAIRTDTELPPRFLDHLELTRDDFENAVSLDEFRQAWKRFLRPDDILAVYYKSNLRLLRNIQADFSPGVLLKAVYSDLDRRHDSLHELVETEGIQTGPQRQPGRAGRRLAQSLAAAEQLSRWKSLLP